MEDQPLHPAERDLAAIVSQHPSDWLLAELADNADHGLGICIGLMVNGMVVTGWLGSLMEIGRVTDAARLSVVDAISERPEDRSEGEWAEMKERYGSLLSEQIDEYLKGKDEMDERLAEVDPQEKLPADLDRKSIAYQGRSALTLRDARISAPSQYGVMRVETLRVELSHVTGWWPVSVDSSGSARIHLFEAEDAEADEPGEQAA
jgi:hypothetical protein